MLGVSPASRLVLELPQRERALPGETAWSPLAHPAKLDSRRPISLALDPAQETTRSTCRETSIPPPRVGKKLAPNRNDHSMLGTSPPLMISRRDRFRIAPPKASASAYQRLRKIIETTARRARGPRQRRWRDHWCLAVWESTRRRCVFLHRIGPLKPTHSSGSKGSSTSCAGTVHFAEHSPPRLPLSPTPLQLTRCGDPTAS